MVKLVFTAEYANLFLMLNGLAILFYLGAIQQDRKRAMKFGNYETLQKVAGKSFLKSSNMVLILRLIGISLLLVGISSPVVIEDTPSAKSDYIIAIDSSSSMLTTDMNPSRLEASKQISNDFISQVPEATKVGVVSFSGKANVENELANNKNKAKSSVKNIDIGEEAGTAIGDAIISSSTLLLNSSKKRTVILVTDSSNNVGTPTNESIDFAVNHNVTINTIGIGTDQKSKINIERFDDLNATQAEFPSPDENELQSIADGTGGNSSHVKSKQNFETAFSDIAFTQTRNNLSRLFILLGIMALLIEWVLGSTKYSVIP